MKTIIVLLLTFTAILAASSTRAEDVALVVGIGNYLNLPDAHLAGIDNDVNSMEAALKGAGFQTTLLLDATASEERIRAAFAEAARRVGANDRFVYYQSSHGSRDYHLLTYDTTTDGDHMLSKVDIRDLMAQIHTARKSLILDACFAGGFNERGSGSRQVKFYPIRSLKEPPTQGIRDRTDTVVRNLAPDADLDAVRRDFVVFASSQDNQASQVDRIDGTLCSIFTHFLVLQLNANPRAAWNTVVQSTIAAVLHFTGASQTPVFDSAFLSFRVYTTDERAEEPGGGVSVPIRNLAQLYDINNVDANRLALSARLDGRNPAEGEIYHPNTDVRLSLKVGAPGYLFVINRDDEDMAQMVGWDDKDLDLTNPDRTVDESHLDGPDQFSLGKGSLKITTSHRKGIEHWKAFLFTDRADAVKFAQMWLALPMDEHGHVRLRSFSNSKLNQITRIGVSSVNGGRSLYTSEVHYRVTDW